MADVPQSERQIAASFAVPPAMLGPAPPMDTIRQRADYYTAMSEVMGLDPFAVAEHDPSAQRQIAHDRLRQQGVIRDGRRGAS